MKNLLVFCLFSFNILAGPGSGGGGHFTLKGRVVLNADILGIDQNKLNNLVSDLKNKDFAIILPNSVISDIRTIDENKIVPNKDILLNEEIKDIQLTNGNILKNN